MSILFAGPVPVTEQKVPRNEPNSRLRTLIDLWTG